MTAAVGSGAPPLVEWGAAAAALDGAPHSGDLHVVAPYPGGVLVAAIDGLGHGPEAALAARAAADVLEASAGAPLERLFDQCHDALRKTRGAVMSLAAFDARSSTVSWGGVGNVEGILLRASGARRESISLRGGIVGYQLPPLRVTSVPVAPGDTLVLATDGIRSAFVAGLPGLRGGVQGLADAIFAEFSRGSDDALVVVARWLGTVA
ncbi:MAG: SpoIIE family protein phosphatase [Anaeromyxobacteraceae bacterium]